MYKRISTKKTLKLVIATYVGTVVIKTTQGPCNQFLSQIKTR